MSERELVKICMQELCVKAGLGGSINIGQRDLDFLCESIEAKTGILISLSTIKRLFNGQFSRLPQVATLNAIAIFIGYPNWNTYKVSKAGQLLQAPPPGEDDPKITLPSPARRKFLLTKFWFLGGFACLIAVAFLASVKIRRPGVSGVETAQFSAKKVTSNDLPNSVIFNYNVDDIVADSFFIQQSWDRRRRVKIFKNHYTLTDIYYEPGYHRAKLIANDQVIKTLEVSIPTDRWFFYALERVAQSLPKYILPTKYAKNGSLQLLKSDLLNSEVKIEKENEFLQVYFPSEIQSSSDNFVLRAKVRVNELRNNACPYFTCEVYCQNNFIVFSNTLKGCTSEINAMFGENYLSGKTTDLSAMGLDVTVWNDLELVVKNKHVTITINNAKIFSARYDHSGGFITGFGFMSNGLCEVDFLDIKTLDGKSIYSNNFD